MFSRCLNVIQQKRKKEKHPLENLGIISGSIGRVKPLVVEEAHVSAGPESLVRVAGLARVVIDEKGELELRAGLARLLIPLDEHAAVVGQPRLSDPQVRGHRLAADLALAGALVLAQLAVEAQPMGVEAGAEGADGEVLSKLTLTVNPYYSAPSENLIFGNFFLNS